jgi:predicted TIM-barrel enzyme
VQRGVPVGGCIGVKTHVSQKPLVEPAKGCAFAVPGVRRDQIVQEPDEDVHDDLRWKIEVDSRMVMYIPSGMQAGRTTVCWVPHQES